DFHVTGVQTCALPISNWRTVSRIGEDIERRLTEHPDAPPVLCISGHGITTWGQNLSQARDRAECLEALCELLLRTGGEIVFRPRSEERRVGKGCRCRW